MSLRYASSCGPLGSARPGVHQDLESPVDEVVSDLGQRRSPGCGCADFGRGEAGSDTAVKTVAPRL